jgi:ATP-dependent Clp protease ATP-binding subunit ClpC
MDISLEAIRSEVERVERVIGRDQEAYVGDVPFSSRSRKVVELSHREALQFGHNYISTEHILLGILRDNEGIAAQILQKLGAELGRMRKRITEILSGYTGPSRHVWGLTCRARRPFASGPSAGAAEGQEEVALAINALRVASGRAVESGLREGTFRPLPRRTGLVQGSRHQ